HPTRRHHPRRAASLAPHRPVQRRPRPPGDGPALRCRLVAAARRPPSGLPPPHRPRRPHGPPPARHRGPAAPTTRPPARPPTPPRRALAPRPAELPGQGRTGPSRQPAAALRPDTRLSPRHLLRSLALLKARYRRTATAVQHKQDPTKAARARQVLGG